MAVPRRPRAARKPRAPKKAYGRSYKKWMSSAGEITVHHSVVSGSGDLEAAAEVIADAARKIAGGWSKQIPPSIQVEVNGSTATISSDAPPAYPNEIAGVRHPLFGLTGKANDRRMQAGLLLMLHGKRTMRGHWYLNQYRPFLSRAADEHADKATARYADKIDKMCRARGFK